MTEIGAAIGIEQLKKADNLVQERVDIANYLNENLNNLTGITLPIQRKNTRPVYYMYQMRFDEEKVGVSRELFAKALSAEGFPTFLGFSKPLYMLPVFQNQVAIGRNGFPFNKNRKLIPFLNKKISYKKGICPIAEDLHEKKLMGFDCCCIKLNLEDLELLTRAFKKVFNNKNQLVS